MAQTATFPQVTSVSRAREAATTAVPWYIWWCAAAVTSGAVGGVWDISWHESIGRDTFWTPAHILIQACGIIAGLVCAYLILHTTFDKTSDLRAAGVTMWGFRGPLGAFLCAWGALAMITSAPFDNWWHNAYGLDVKILSPPHVLLALGMMGIRFGTVVLIAAAMNRAEGAARRHLRWFLIYGAAFLLGTTVGIMQERTNRIVMHGAEFYLVIMMAAPVWLAMISRAVESRWPATIMVGMFSGIHLIFDWVLPLFPAQPKLGPVYQQITHLVPPDFPLLLIVAAVAFDLARRFIGSWNKWTQSAILGAIFMATFVMVQWPFADFLNSPAAQNRFFVANNYPYFVPSASPWVQGVFVATEKTLGEFAVKMFLALVFAILTTRLGFAWGDWLRRIKR
jgi:hypothetical protein